MHLSYLSQQLVSLAGSEHDVLNVVNANAVLRSIVVTQLRLDRARSEQRISAYGTGSALGFPAVHYKV